MSSSTPHALSAVLGRHLFTSKGAYVGDIVELLFDLEQGQVRFAVVIPGGPFGIENRWLCVPFGSIRYSPEHDCFILRSDYQVLNSHTADATVRKLVRERGRPASTRSSTVSDASSEAPLRRHAANAE